MWQTPLGTRSLQGSEAELFRVAAGIHQDILLDMVENNEPDMGGDLKGDRWEQIPWHQQICAIGEVARYVLDYTDEEPPALAAWSELTIWKIYDFLIDSEDVESFGKLVVRASFEAGFLRKKRKISAKEYKDLVGRLRDRLLHEREFTPEDVEEVRSQGMAVLGLGDEYFSKLFPAFTMERFLASLTLLNDERVESASALLPDHCRSRFDANLDAVSDPIEWHPPAL